MLHETVESTSEEIGRDTTGNMLEIVAKFVELLGEKS